MLPSEKATSIAKHRDGHLGYIPTMRYNRDWSFVEKDWTNFHHLYFLSDEEIKEGDWFYDTLLYTSQKCSKNQIVGDLRGKKIIATTDESLVLPRPSDSFIKAYCEQGGIDEVLVEYEIDDTMSMLDISDYYPLGESYYCKLKVAPDNTISIKPVKNSWIREEVVALCKKAYKDSNTTGLSEQGLENEANKWINQNLS